MGGTAPPCRPGWLDWLTGVEDALGSIEGEGAAWLQRIATRVIQHAFLESGDRVLDLGAGTGLLSLLAAVEVGGAGSVTAVDADAACLEALAARGAERGVHNLTTINASIEALPFADDAFDAVVCRSVLAYSDDLRLPVSEMARVLAPAGRFSLFEPLIAELEWQADLGPLEAAFRQMEGVLAARGAALDRVKLRGTLRGARLGEMDSLVVHFTLSGGDRSTEELVQEYLEDLPGPLSAYNTLIAAGFTADIINEVARAFAVAVSSNQAKGLLPCLFAWGSKE